MQKLIQPQTTINNTVRDATALISEAAETSENHCINKDLFHVEHVTTELERLKTALTTINDIFKPYPSIAARALNGTKGRGDYFVRVKFDSEWNEIIVKLTDGTCTRASQHIDCGHTKESKSGAVEEAYATVKHFLEN